MSVKAVELPYDTKRIEGAKPGFWPHHSLIISGCEILFEPVSFSNERAPQRQEKEVLRKSHKNALALEDCVDFEIPRRYSDLLYAGGGGVRYACSMWF